MFALGSSEASTHQRFKCKMVRSNGEMQLSSQGRVHFRRFHCARVPVAHLILDQRERYVNIQTGISLIYVIAPSIIIVQVPDFEKIHT